jgi:hypothetical protein
MKFGWRIVLGSFVGLLGAMLGSIGGVGGGGIFVPMLTLIIGFDPKSSAAMSKCEGSVHLLYYFIFYVSTYKESGPCLYTYFVIFAMNPSTSIYNVLLHIVTLITTIPVSK